jgi:lysophospholipase L1-like esterase
VPQALLLPTPRDACQKIDTRWVEPAFWGTNFVPVHPNALGDQKMAEAVLAAIG